uniref:Myosin motor domain-containing protein n=1 Tax=Glossina brevipalpis TaxID=37001 RepID=A0A1A9X456_9MUSC
MLRTSNIGILFRSGILSELEAKRDELLSDRIIQLQAFCRGYLARKSMSQRRVQVSNMKAIYLNNVALLASACLNCFFLL